MTDASGSSPLREKYEIFAQRCAMGGETLADSWIEATLAVGRPAPQRNSAQVSASRARKRDDVSARIEFIRRERVAARDAERLPVTRTALIELAEETQRTLLQAAQTASAIGNEALASKLRKLTSGAASRFLRLQKKTGMADAELAREDGPDGATLLNRLLCDCA